MQTTIAISCEYLDVAYTIKQGHVYVLRLDPKGLIALANHLGTKTCLA